MDPNTSVITLTFGDQAENHVGMEKIGKLVAAGQGFTLQDFREIVSRLPEDSPEFELPEIIPLHSSDMPEAYVLVIHNGVDLFLGKGTSKKLFEEQSKLDVDKKAFMYGRVVEKKARWNLCFDEKAHEPDYERGMGRVVSFDQVPLTMSLLQAFSEYVGEKAADLKGEGNYYYDVKKCGIGFHGDSERRKVIAVRLGARLDLHYQWYKGGEAVGERITIPLVGGDIYLMSEKAVGTDWKRKTVYTLRHATGCDKFTK